MARDIALLTVTMFALFMNRGITAPVLSLYAQSLGASYVMIGLLSTAASLMMVLSSYLWGRQSDRMARRKLLLSLGLGMSALACGFTALIPSYPYLLLLHTVDALAQAAAWTTSLALIGDLLEWRSGRGRSMGIYRGLGSLGFALMAFLSGTIADRTSLRAPFVLAGGFSLVALIISLFIRETPTCAESSAVSPRPSTVRVVLPRPPLPIAPLLVSAFVWSLAFSAVLAVWPNYMVNERGYTTAAVGRLWSLAAFCELPFMIVTGGLSDRVGRLPMLSLGLMCFIGVFLGYVTVPSIPWILPIQVLRGFAMAAFTATAMVYVTEVTSQERRGRASGLYTSIGGLGAMLGGAVGGSLTQWLGFVPMIVIAAGLMGLGVLYLVGVSVSLGRRAIPS